MVVLNRGELAKVMRHITFDDSGCWLWTGPLTPSGYGRVRARPGDPERAVHRVLWEHFTGEEIPDGLQLDHVKERCSNRHCCNPSHLEPVTPSENINRSRHANRHKTECPKGHPYTPENTRTEPNGKRHCRTCDLERKMKV